LSSLSAASSASSLLGTGRLSVTGLASGLDVDSIISGLLAIEQKRVEKLQADSAKVQQQQGAFKGIEARLLSLQGQLFQLGRTQNGVFDVKAVTSSDEKLIGAAASSSAQPGVYELRANTLARTHQVASQGFDSANSLVTQGSFEIRTGTGAATTITIDGTNNSLQGLADAINNSGVGITAQIVNDGSASGRQPFRLLLTSGKTGASNAIVITNNLAADGGSAYKPVFNQAYTGRASLDPGFTGTSIPASNSGAGAFTGTSNNLYTFTVVAGGTVGTDNNIQVAYTDANGANSGTLTINAGDADVLKTVAQGIEVQFSAGTLLAGETFTVRGFVPQVQAATDASVTLGSGPGALTVFNSTNQFDGLFAGITLDLKEADPAKVVTITVANDTAKPRQAIQDFVTAFNGVMEFVDEQIRYDAEANVAGVLLGDRQATAIQDQLRNVVLAPIAGLKSQMNRLSNLGITLTDKGRLTLDQGKLDNALTGKVAGVTLEDVRRLFALTGSSTQSGIQFVTASNKTKASVAPYQVVVTQAADQAKVQAANPLAASTVINGTNNSLTLQVDGLAAITVTLADGTYSRLALAQELQTRINASANLAGRNVTVGLDSDRLVVTSNTYGSSSQVAISGGTALASLGFLGTEIDAGQDVVGHFLVNGQIELATATGQTLLGVSNNANTADLQVRVTLTPTQVGAGITADLTVTRGIASNLDLSLSQLLDPVTGRMKSINEGFQNRVDGIKDTIDRQNLTAQRRRDALLRQFVSLETTISQLQNLGNYLSTQFAQINSIYSQK